MEVICKSSINLWVRQDTDIKQLSKRLDGMSYGQSEAKYNQRVNLETIESILQGACRLQRDRWIVIGVSGGPDSLCLLDILHRLKYRLHVAHLDHQMRSESKAEADHVRSLAQHLGLPISIQVEDVPGLACAKNLSIEEAARLARYRFLFAEARRISAQAVAVAHTADDQVETILMHLLQGSGLTGLKGMQLYWLKNAWSDRIPLVRPLLECWRSEIMDYCRERNLEPVQDASNLNLEYLRNRIRHELIPLLESYNPKIKSSLLRMGKALQGDDAVLRGAVEQAWERVLIAQSMVSIRLDAGELEKQPAGLQRLLLRKGILSLLEDRQEIGFEVIERALGLLADKQKRQMQLKKGLKLSRVSGEVHIFYPELENVDQRFPQLQSQCFLNIPGNQQVDKYWSIHAEFLKMDDLANNNLDIKDGWQAFLDNDVLRFPLAVRKRKPGDRFQPYGMHALQKLSDYFINHKLPAPLRADWPLVLSADQIIWIPGFQSAQPVRIQDSTRTILHLHLVKSRDDPTPG